MREPILISTGNLTQQSLSDKVVVITGAGGGIGFEAARSLVWLGAKVVIAEIDSIKGQDSADAICQEFGEQTCKFVQTDVGDERSVAALASQAKASFGKVDILINNATIAPLGAIIERSIADWDASYRVNLRGPVLLTQTFLPGMIERHSGVVMYISSVGGAYMGTYESLKSAQVEVSRTLAAEMEDKGIVVFAIGPGIVPTETALRSISQIAGRFGKTTEEFFATFKDMQLSIEAAGAGFAAAAALADQFRGMEIASLQALIVAGIAQKPDESEEAASLSAKQAEGALHLCQEVRATLAKEADGWRQRSIFQRQWMLRDFKQNAGEPVEQALEELTKLETALEQKDFSKLCSLTATPGRVKAYYAHYISLAKSATRDPQKLAEIVEQITGWERAAGDLADLLSTNIGN